MSNIIPIVENRFNFAQTYATTMYNNALSAINNLTSWRTTIITTPQNITFTKPPEPTEVPVSPTNAKPSYGSVPAEPGEPNAVVIPASPTINTPTSPTMLPIVIPDFISTTTIPDFTSVVPRFTLEKLSTPEITALRNDYASALNTSIRAKLLSNIDDGGTGLDATVEAAIFARGTERDSNALQDIIDKTTSQWAKMGFTLPDGLLSAELAALNEAYLNKRLDTSRDISIEQAKLEQENLKYTLQYAITLEMKMFDLADKYADRAFDASKATATIIVEIYKSNLAAYSAQVDAYKAEAEAHKAFIQAKLAEIEVYKGKIEGQKLIVDINDANIKLYNAQWEGEINKTKLYESQLRAAAVQIEYNKSIIERFAEQVKAYVAKSNALTEQYNADVNVYKADIEKWIAKSDRDIKGADGSLKADVANVEKYLKDQQVALDVAKWGWEHGYAKLRDTAALAAQVAAGALAGASAQAAMSVSETVD
jgi:hypothetical protein